MKQFKYLFTAAMLAFAVTACDEGTGGTAPVTGTVTGAVTVEGAGQGGVTVTLTGGTQTAPQTTTTDGSGNYTFPNVAEGTYVVSITPPDGTTFTTTAQGVTISAGSTGATASFAGEFIRTSAISGSVVAGGEALAGVGVALSGAEARTTSTDNNGGYAFSGLRAGSYTVTITPPSDIEFTVTTQNVTLGSGDAQVVNFVGELPLTAAVAIKSITTGDTQTPVDPTNVNGQIDVLVFVDDPDNQASAVAVAIDDVVCAGCRQEFGTSAMGEDGAALVVTDILFTILTDRVDPETGAVDFLNGERQLTAFLETAQGEAIASTSQTLNFTNTDKWVILSAGTGNEGQPVIGEDQNPWWGNGDLTVTATGAAYSGKTVSSASASMTNIGAGDDSDTGAGAEGVWTFEFDAPETDDPAGSALSIAGNYAEGGTVVSNNLLTLWLDQTGPAPGTFVLTNQTDDEVCCSNNWFNPGYEFDDGYTQGVDAGVGRETAAFWAFDEADFTDPSAPTDTEIVAAVPDGYSGDSGGDMGLPPSEDNLAWVMVVQSLDGLGNTTFDVLQAGGDHPNPAQAGHDAQPPTSAVCTGAGTPNAACGAASVEDGDIFNIASPYAGNPYLIYAVDPGLTGLGGPSGLTPGAELFGTIEFYNDEDDGWVCDDPNFGMLDADDVCQPVAMAGTNSGGVPALGSQNIATYARFNAFTRDRAGNFGEPLDEQIILRDEIAPSVDNIGRVQPPFDIEGGSTQQFVVEWSDNLDAASLTHTLAVNPDPGVLFWVGEEDLPGEGFDEDLNQSGIAQPSVSDFIVRYDNTGVTSAAAPGLVGGATAHTPVSFVEWVVDVAGNADFGTLAIGANVEASTGIIAKSGNLISYGFTNPAGVILDVADGDSETLNLKLTGALGQVSSPCVGTVSMSMLMQVAGTSVQIPIGTMNGPTLEEDDVERRWQWTYTYTPVAADVGANFFMATCRNGDGDALITFRQINVINTP